MLASFRVLQKCVGKSQQDHRFLRKNTLRRANHLSDVTGRLMVCCALTGCGFRQAPPLLSRLDPRVQGAAPPVPRARALGTALQEPGSQALRRNRRASPGLHPRGWPWLEIDFRQKTPAPPIRFSKAKRREAPTTHGLKREGDNSNLKASNPMAQAGFGCRTYRRPEWRLHCQIPHTETSSYLRNLAVRRGF
jgi:hypothetical protein